MPGVAIMNIQQRYWCFNYCPLGKLQDEQAKCCKKKLALPKWVSWVRYLILTAIVVGYFLILAAATKAPLTSMFWFKNVFSVSVVVLAVALIVLVLSFFFNRFFCNTMCPIGAVGDLVLKLEGKIK